MISKRVTKRAVDALEAGATLWDGEIKGFGCRRTPNGVASYVVKYRANGRQRWYTIGRHGSPWTTDAARVEAKSILGDVAKGKDPATERSKRLKGETLRAFSESYLRDHAEKRKKPRSVEEDRKLLNNLILPRFGSVRMDGLSKQDVAKFMRDMSSTPYQANRVLALLRHMYAKAAEWGIVEEGVDPTKRVQKYPEKARDRFLSSDELACLGAVLAEEEAAGRNPYVVAAIRLLILTGARLNEILTLKWQWVDIEERVLRLPDSKTGKKLIHLPAPACGLLSSLPRQADNPHVICGAKAGSHLINLQKPWMRLRSKAGLDDVRLHDLRHSFASVAVSGGMSLPMIGALLGHRQAQTTQRYAHLANDPLRNASELVAEAITQRLLGLQEAQGS